MLPTSDSPEQSTPMGFWRRTARTLIAICIPLIALGQWVDTRDLIIDSYQGFITHFTNEVELEKLAEVRIDGNLDYLEGVFGVARLIKESQLDDQFEYRYYYHPKFLLTLAVKQGRIKGYMVTSLKDDFKPEVSFSPFSLGDKALSDLQPFNGVFTADAANIHFYIEQHQLSREGLFFNRYLAHLEYGASLTDKENQKPGFLAEPINRLTEAYTLEQTEKVRKALTNIRSKALPNSYAIGDITLPIAAEMILTRYEFAAYFAPRSST